MFANENVYSNLNKGYVSNPRNIYDSFINALNELKEKIILNVENILVQKDETSLDELIENLKDSFNNTENILYCKFYIWRHCVAISILSLGKSEQVFYQCQSNRTNF